MLQNDNVLIRLVFLSVLLVLAGALIGSGILQVLSGGFSTESVNLLAQQQPQLFRFSLLLVHVFSFTFPAILALYLVFGGKWWQEVGLNRLVHAVDFGQYFLFAAVCLPIVAYSIWLNLQIDLPAWALKAEDEVSDTMAAVLDMKGVADLLMSLLVVGVAAAVGEELLLRGVVQGQIFKRISPHLAISLAAFLFSIMHFELAGLLPRYLLGVVLGYTYYWSSSLWVPIVLHLLFNGLQVLNVYVTGEYQADTELVEPPSVWLLLVALPLAVYLFSRLSMKASKSA